MLKLCCYFLRTVSIYISKVNMANFLWRAVPEEINNLFEHKIFFCAASSCFCRYEKLFFCAKCLLFFVDMKLSRAIPTSFCRHHITSGATSNFFFLRKIVFRARLNFCFGHYLECYVMMIYFHCHIATKI